MKRLAAFLAGLLLVLTASAAWAADILTPAEAKWLAAHGPLKVGYFVGYPPFSYQKGGELRGLCRDYWLLLAKKIGGKVEFVPGRYAQLMPMMRRGELDSLAGLFYTIEYASQFDFTPDFARIDTYIYVRKGLEDRDTIAKLKGVKVGVVSGDSSQALAQGGGLDFRAYAGYLECIKALLDGQVQAMIMDGPVADYAMDRLGLKGDMARVGEPVHSVGVALPVARKAAVLRDILMKGAASITPQELDAIRKQWLR